VDNGAEFWTDNMAPVSTITTATQSVPGTNGWYTSYGATLTVSDFPTAAPSGVATWFVGVGSTVTTNTFATPPATATVFVTPLNGTTTITAYAIDAASNVETRRRARCQARLGGSNRGDHGFGRLHGQQPDSTVVTFTITAGDLTSGVNKIRYQFITQGSTVRRPDLQGGPMWPPRPRRSSLRRVRRRSTRNPSDNAGLTSVLPGTLGTNYFNVFYDITLSGGRHTHCSVVSRRWQRHVEDAADDNLLGERRVHSPQ